MEWLEPLLDWVRLHPGWAGLILFLIALTESLAAVGLFVPGAMLMFGAGTLIASGHLAFGSSVAWAATGAIAGDGISFWLGRYFGPQLHGVWPFRRYPQLVARSERFFRDHGGKSVLLGRFVGPIRPVIPAVAGMLGMPAGRFLLVNVLSAVLWAPAYLLPGAVFAASLSLAADVATRLLVLLAAAALAAWLAWLLLSALHSGLRRTALAGYLAHRRSLWLGLAGLMLVVPVLALGLHVWQLRQLPEPEVLTLEQWLQEGAARLPAYRAPLQEAEEAFSLQLAGSASAVTAALRAQDWEAAHAFDLRGSLLWLSPQPDVRRLPLLPRWHQGRQPALAFVRPMAGDGYRRWVLELWPTQLRVRTVGPVWQGRLVRERLEPGWPVTWQEEELAESPGALPGFNSRTLRGRSLLWLDQETAAR